MIRILKKVLFVSSFLTLLSEAALNKMNENQGEAPRFYMKFPERWKTGANLFGSDFVSFSELNTNSGTMIVKYLKRPPQGAKDDNATDPTRNPQAFLTQQTQTESEQSSYEFYKVMKNDIQGVFFETDGKLGFNEANFFRAGKRMTELKYIQVLSADEYIYVTFRAPQDKYPDLKPLALETIRSIRPKFARR